jgi:putative ABC transport system substrate-binding protein
MRRRDFITLLGGAAATWPLAARAQANRLRRIGVLMPYIESDPEGQANIAAFRSALQSLGWLEGRNVRLDYRWTAGNADLVRTYAKELIAHAPDSILTASVQFVAELRRQTRTIPIVFGGASDPVEAGLVASLAHPGGNITGFTSIQYETNVKWLELLKEAAPQVSRVAVMLNSEDPSWAGRWQAIEAAAPSFNVELTKADVHDDAEIVRVLDSFSRQPNGGMIVLVSPFTILSRGTIIALAAKHQLPAVYPQRVFVASGGLISYAADQLDQYRRAATYVDRILRGEKPGDLPVQTPTKFELVINLKAAKAIDLTVPPLLLARADDVIE